MKHPFPHSSGLQAGTAQPAPQSTPPTLRLVASAGADGPSPSQLPGTLSFGPDAQDLPREQQPTTAHRCRSRIELYLAARALQPAKIELVAAMAAASDLDAALAGVVGRIRRCTPRSEIVVLAGAVTPDLQDALASAGATLAIPAGEGQQTHDVHLGEADWREWLKDTYALTADETTERILARLAAADDRTTIAQALVDDGVLAHPQAVRRIRQITKALAGEEYRSPGAVAHEARRALAGLAAVAPLRWRPLPDVSLTKAAARLRAAPSLAAAAGLSARETSVLFAIDAELAGARVTRRPTVGTPPRAASAHARQWAARRVAGRGGATAETVDAVGAELLALASGAARAIAEAQAESMQFPQARLAAAIDTVDRLAPGSSPDWLPGADDHVRWQGFASWQVASCAPAIPLPLAVQLTRALDAALVEHRALDAALRLSGDEQRSPEGLE